MAKQLGIEPVTLKMVAERAECSISLASTALNKARGNTVVSDKTRKHILNVARELGYRPNYLSQSLKTRRSRTLGLYVQPGDWRGVGNRYEMAIFGGIETVTAERGYDIVILNMSQQTAPRVCAERLAESRIDGILLLHADHKAEWIDQLSAVCDRVVAVDCCLDSPGLNRVLFDNAAAVRMAVEHLAELGHRRIGFIGPCTQSGAHSSPDRETFFRQAVGEFGLDGDPALIHALSTCAEPVGDNEPYCQIEGERGMGIFAGLARPPTAVVAYNLLAGLFAMRAAQEMGLNVPGQMSVVGIDDMELVQYFKPQLTRVDHPLPEMGKAGANLLVDLIEGGETAPVCRMFPPSLIPGGSTAAPGARYERT